MSHNTSELKWYKQGLGAVVLCVIVGLSLTYLDVFSTFNQNWIDRDVRAAGIRGEVYFLVVSMVITGLGGPRQLVSFLGGYAFGVTLGTFLALVGTVLGCMTSFYVSRFLVRPFVVKKFRNRITQVDAFWHRFPTRKTIIIRMLPVGSNILTNIIAGASKINAYAFFSGSTVGYLPQTLIFALLGKGIVIGSEWKVAVSGILFIISGFLSFKLYQRYKNDSLQIKTK